MELRPIAPAVSTGRAGEGSRRALLLGDDLGVFLAVARALGRRGIAVHLVPAEDDLPGLASRYVSAIHPLPLYRHDPGAWVAALRRLVAAHDYRLILPCCDSAMVTLAHHAAEIGPERAAVPNAEALAAFADKRATRRLAAALGITVAEGLEIGAGDGAAALIERLGLPLVLKPRASYRVGGKSTKERAVIAHDRAEAETALAAGGTGWLAERFFEGEGVGFSVLARDGEILLEWQHRRLHTVSETGASSARTAEPPDIALRADVEKLCRATRLTGVAMFEFRRNATGHCLIEVNARFWGSLPLALAAGADFPGALWEMCTGGEPRIGPVQRSGVTRRSMTGEIDRLAGEVENARSPVAKMRAAAAVLGFVPTMLLRSRFDSWAADDPEPFRVERRQLLRRIAGAIRTTGKGA